MKKLFYLPFLIFFCSFALSGKPDKRKKPPGLKFTPYGTVWLRDSLFIDKTEITNLNYREFLYWIQRVLPKSYYVSMLPDTSVWGNICIHGLLAKRYYFRYPYFQDYPVVGISYYQAVEFCKWRTDRVNEFIEVTRKIIKWDPNGSIYKGIQYVKYRLPTKEEWEYAASAGLDFNRYPMGYKKIIAKHNLPVSDTREYALIKEMKLNDTASKGHYTHFFMTGVMTGKPNEFNVLNLLGNVSEIIADSLYKGLNYTRYINNASSNFPDSTYNYKQTFTYSKPETWLGFRCVCELIRQ